MIRYYPIEPVGKPRMTQADRITLRKLRTGQRLKPRDGGRAPRLARWLAFVDAVRLCRVEVPAGGAHVVFLVRMPPSWTDARRAERRHMPHRGAVDNARKLDVDNLVKCLLDAVYGDDSSVWDLRASKVWADEPGLVVADEALALGPPLDLAGIRRAAR